MSHDLQQCNLAIYMNENFKSILDYVFLCSSKMVKFSIKIIFPDNSFAKLSSGENQKLLPVTRSITFLFIGNYLPIVELMVHPFCNGSKTRDSYNSYSNKLQIKRVASLLERSLKIHFLIVLQPEETAIATIYQIKCKEMS